MTEVFMRRFIALIAIPLLACLALVGCGSSKPAAPANATNEAVKVTGAFGLAPKVTFPKAKADNTLTVKTLIEGSGPALTKSDSMAANFLLYFWTGTSTSLKADTYTSNPAVIGGTMLPGLETALIGKKAGSRVLAVIPPKDGYGSTGDSELGITSGTTLVFVIDVISVYSSHASASGTQLSNGGDGLPTVTAKPGSAPTVTIQTKTTPPTTLQSKILIKGNGAKLVKGDYVIAQYVGYIWRTGKVFGSSWTDSEPFGFVLDASPEQVIPGWDQALTGQTVGSRLLLVIPPKDGYGKSGASSAGIKGTDTLVFVVDIIDAMTLHATS
jgi:FKBP-type peptidyl-prolyl cis-trans isomerase